MKPNTEKHTGLATWVTRFIGGAMKFTRVRVQFAASTGVLAFGWAAATSATGLDPKNVPLPYTLIAFAAATAGLGQLGRQLSLEPPQKLRVAAGTVISSLVVGASAALIGREYLAWSDIVTWAAAGIAGVVGSADILKITLDFGLSKLGISKKPEAKTDGKTGQ